MTRENYIKHLNEKYAEFIGKIVKMDIKPFGDNEIITYEKVFFQGFLPDNESDEDIVLNIKTLIRQMNGSLLLVDMAKPITSDIMDFETIIFQKYNRNEPAKAEA